MIKSVHRDLRHSIKLDKDYSWSCSVRYYPLVRKKDSSSLVFIRKDSNGFGALSLNSPSIRDVPGDRQEITKLLVKHINQACKKMEIKFPRLTIGFYKNTHNKEDFRLRYYNREQQAYIIADYYTTNKDDMSDYETAIGIQLSRYITPHLTFKSYQYSYWYDPHSYYNGIIYFQERFITPEVARDLLLHQIENNIRLSSFLKKRLDDDGREAVDTAINLLKLKGVA